MTHNNQCIIEPILEENDSKWISQVEHKLGRPLKVLYVGNVANNAYLNAKLIRKHGIDIDVLCYDYYHIMGAPEWEDLNINHPVKNDFYPIFNYKDTLNYNRPDWFINGPLPLCYFYIEAKHSNKKIHMLILSLLMKLSRRSEKSSAIARTYGYKFISLNYHKNNSFDNVGHSIPAKILYNLYRFFSFVDIGLAYNLRRILTTTLSKESIQTIKDFINKFSSKTTPDSTRNSIESEKQTMLFNQLIERFQKTFPTRSDQLKIEDLLPYSSVEKIWNRIFSHYDIVQCFGTDPVNAIIGQAQKYVAFEHGTLRTFTLEDNPISRLNSLGYRNADHTFITNGDCLDYAKKLGIKNYSAMIHPVLQYAQRKASEKSVVINRIRSQYDADILLLCPLRHDWKIKGTDVHLRALPEIKKRINKKIVLLLTDWGDDATKSRALIEELGCTDNVQWMKPISRAKLMDLMIASDVVLDQIGLPCFGGTAPQAIALEVPVIMSYKPESTAWIVSEEAPIIPAFNVDDVVKGILQALDTTWLSEYKNKATDWFNKHHHSDRIVSEHLDVYQRLMENNLTRSD